MMNRKLIAKAISGSDGFGNSIICKPPEFRVILKLNTGKKRNIGKLVKYSDKVYFVIKRDKSKHLLKKANSWGLNDSVVQALPDDCHIILNEKRGSVYYIPVESVKENGSYLWFKNQGFERQIFVELKYWKEEYND